jgi:hypothetical protein
MKRILVIAAIAVSLTACSDGQFGSPTAKCVDGSYSYSRNHQGTCSYHGGVALWYKSQSQLDAGD